MKSLFQTLLLLHYVQSLGADTGDPGTQGQSLPPESHMVDQKRYKKIMGDAIKVCTNVALKEWCKQFTGPDDERQATIPDCLISFCKGGKCKKEKRLQDFRVVANVYRDKICFKKKTYTVTELPYSFIQSSLPKIEDYEKTLGFGLIECFRQDSTHGKNEIENKLIEWCKQVPEPDPDEILLPIPDCLKTVCENEKIKITDCEIDVYIQKVTKLFRKHFCPSAKK